MKIEFWARLGRAKGIRVSALLAGLMSLASMASAAQDLWVGTRNSATGQFTVRSEALKDTFADGTPVGSFSILEAPESLLGISNGFLLVRRTTPGSGTCRTEATALHLHGAKAYLNLDLVQHVVLLCANPPSQACGSCKIERDLDGYFCACIKNGAVAGECLGLMNDILKNDLIVDWLGPNPDPEENPGPHPDNR